MGATGGSNYRLARTRRRHREATAPDREATAPDPGPSSLHARKAQGHVPPTTAATPLVQPRWDCTSSAASGVGTAPSPATAACCVRVSVVSRRHLAPAARSITHTHCRWTSHATLITRGAVCASQCGLNRCFGAKASNGNRPVKLQKPQLSLHNATACTSDMGKICLFGESRPTRERQ